ncbi:HlyD family efflux transporter periplasmic adaptor subunit [Pseudoalteromonas sp. T1lg23B]|uniref:HlyD family efflux transporter periplasmic adaptor subunit n=1 Tax=Pseudoalteromonas sp. T1lg23B TaxID=2077097 RepID=UPI000CF65769|nr:HlyD family efflux transporter periplasmic adaptor subunit [Pseudoalteromonas sp. T1lg23B]
MKYRIFSPKISLSYTLSAAFGLLFCTLFTPFLSAQGTELSAGQTVDKVIPFFGIVHYRNARPVYSQFGGIISQLFVQGGQQVDAGQSLVKIERLEIGFSTIEMKNEIPDGVVSRVNVREGHHIEPYDPIMVVADASEYIIKLNVSQVDLNKLQPIGKAEVVFAPNSSQPFSKSGQVHAIHEPNQGKFGLYEIEILVDCSSDCVDVVKSGSIAKVLMSPKTPVQVTATVKDQSSKTRQLN